MARCKCDWKEPGAAERVHTLSRLTTSDREEMYSYFPAYIIRKTIPGSKRKSCFCTKCKASFDVSPNDFKNQLALDIFLDDHLDEIYRAKHNEYAACPLCLEEAQVIDAFRMRGQNYKMFKQLNFVVFHAEADGALSASAYSGVLDFAGNDWDADPYYVENYRYRFYPGSACAWENGGRDGWRIMKSVRDPYPTPYGSSGINKYLVINGEVIDQTELHYWGADLAMFEVNRAYSVYPKSDGLIRYLGEYCHRPQLEMLSRLSFYDAIQDLIFHDKANSDLLNWRAKTLPKFLRLSKADTKYFMRSGNITLRFLKILQEAERDGQVDRDLICFADRYGSTMLSDIENHLHGRDVHAVIRYIAKKAEDIPRFSPRFYLDYIQMAEQLELDLTADEVMFPKDLVARHDECSALVETKKNQKLERSYKKLYDGYRRVLEFEHDGLQIIVPKNTSDIVVEGQQQHNCVARYAESHLRGNTVILFLRSVDEPEKSLVTIEASTDDYCNLKQVYGYHNDLGKNGMDRAVNKYAPWLDIWKNWIRSGSPRDRKGKPVITDIVPVAVAFRYTVENVTV